MTSSPRPAPSGTMRPFRWPRLYAFLTLVLLPMGLVSAPAVIQPDRWHFIRVHGHLMYYAIQGSGPTLVLLHGGGDSGAHTFEQQFTMFSLHHRIVAPDQVGQGHTPAVPGPLSYTHMMQDTVAVLQQLNLRNVDVMGFSDGGI